MALGWACALPPSAGLILPSHQVQPTLQGAVKPP